MNLSTLAVHAGALETPQFGPGTTPIYQTTTFALTDEVYAAMREGRSRDILVYSRYDNPTIRAVERKMAALEGAEDALLFSSGMGAISGLFGAYLRPGDRLVISDNLYGYTRTLVEGPVRRYGVEVVFVAGADDRQWEEALRQPARMVYCETISNPLLRLVDLRRVAGLARAAGAISAIDNTFASPVNSRPLGDGFDLVIESATKYLNGHTDVTAGFVSGSHALIKLLWEHRTAFGSNADPHAAYLLERGMKTLVLRVECQNRSAARVTDFLSEHKSVEWVTYPGHTNHPQADLARRQLTGFGGMVAFSVGSDERAINLMRSLKVIKEATSLGGVESVISMPMNTSHARMSIEDLARHGITPGTLRLSVGIEETSDLIADLEQALTA